MEFEELVKKLAKESGLREEDILRRIRRKMTEQDFLITREGAAKLLALELGIRIEGEKEEGRLLMKNLVPGLKKVVVAGRVLRIWEPREFEKEKIKGRVASFLMADESGRARVVIWDNKVEMVGREIREGIAVKVIGGRVKRDRLGRPEIHIDRRSEIEIEPKDISIPAIEELARSPQTVVLADIDEEGRYRVRATIVDVIETSIFYEACPHCASKLASSLGSWICKEHGEVEPIHKLMVIAILDDGTSTMRCAFFGKEAERLLGMSADEAIRAVREKGEERVIRERKKHLLGKEMIVIGDASYSAIGEMSMVAKRAIAPNARAEAMRLLRELEHES